MDTILQIRSNGQVTLPANIRRQANLREGDSLKLEIDENGSIRLTPVAVIERTQAYFWTDRWQAGEREAETDLQAGRYADFDNIDDLLGELETDA